jgi:hypothetical protein
MIVLNHPHQSHIGFSCIASSRQASASLQTQKYYGAVHHAIRLNRTTTIEAVLAIKQCCGYGQMTGKKDYSLLFLTKDRDPVYGSKE